MIADAVSAAIADIGPDAVVHLAYRQPDWVTNAEGSANVARACAATGARLVHLSTDVVFGDRGIPWTEADTPVPDARLRALQGGGGGIRLRRCPVR